MKHILLLLIILTGFARCGEVANEPRDTIATHGLSFPPNILWIVAEDLGPFISSFGDSTVRTPHIESLAAEGVCFDKFYTPHPVCSPARAAIITGMYANAIGASHMRTGPWFSDLLSQEFINSYKALPAQNIPYEAVPPAEVKMFTEYLRSSGYYCSNNSKEDYQFRKTMVAWDESSGTAHWRNRASGQPFFSVFNIGVTHESQIWRKAQDSLQVEEMLQVPVPPYLPDTEISRRDIRRMYSNIVEMDKRVGHILNELKKDGLLDSTIVVWYTDHGGPLPRQKRLLYESGVKVPMVIRFPDGQHAGTRDQRLISFVDLAPTMLSFAGIRPPDYMQGTAFSGEFSRSKEPSHVFGAADRFDEFTDRIRSVSDGRFKYIKNYLPDQPLYADLAYRKQMPIMQELLSLRNRQLLNKQQSLWFQSPKPPEELYDLENDPYELSNLAMQEGYEEILQSLRIQCSEWVQKIGDTGLPPEAELLNRLWPDGKQPITENPRIAVSDDTVRISTGTIGASIGYRLLIPGMDTPQSWKIYTDPIATHGSGQIEAIAHRIGYLRSDTIRLSL